MDLPPLTDAFGRRHTSLRVSVTDRCNIRCFYCMPSEQVAFRPRHELLSFEEIVRFVRIVMRAGINKVRITGGEPLVRSDVCKLVRMLAELPGLDDLAMTTNGMLLSEHAAALRRAGLQRLNVSLDTLEESTFQRITRRRGLQRILDGLEVALRLGFADVRLNALAIRGLTEDQVVPLASFARQRRINLRFIEFMPLDADWQWDSQQVLSGAELRAILTREFGPLRAVPRGDPSQPAVDYEYAGGGRVGFINPVTEPFCGDCNRLRLTAEGKIRNCLFSTVEWDARRLLRTQASDAEVLALVRACVLAKKPGHGIDSEDFLRPARAMYQIGG